MKNTEICHKLALAIGYSPQDVKSTGECCAVLHATGQKNSGLDWYIFDYTDPDVIWPIAKHYKCFPYCSQFDRPGRQWAAYLNGKVFEADTPELVVAMAVIGAAK